MIIKKTKRDEWLVLQKLIRRTGKQPSLSVTNTCTEPVFYFDSHLLHMVVCSRLVIVCVYGGIRVTTAPTVNAQSGERQRETQREREDRPCVEHTILLTLSWCHVGWRPLHHIHAQMLQER